MFVQLSNDTFFLFQHGNPSTIKQKKNCQKSKIQSIFKFKEYIVCYTLYNKWLYSIHGQRAYSILEFLKFKSLSCTILKCIIHCYTFDVVQRSIVFMLSSVISLKTNSHYKNVIDFVVHRSFFCAYRHWIEEENWKWQRHTHMKITKDAVKLNWCFNHKS